MPQPSITFNSVTPFYAPVAANTGVAPLVVLFSLADADLTVVDSNGSPVAYPTQVCEFEWDFGDSNSTETVVDPVTGALIETNSDQKGPSAFHTYTSPGAFVPKVKAWFYDAPSDTWISATKSVTTPLTIQTPAQAGWEIAYCDPSNMNSAQTGTSADPLVSRRQCQEFLNRRTNRALYLASGAVFQPKTNQKYRINITATGGTYTLTFRGAQTNPIPYNAYPFQIVAELRNLPTINGGKNVDVTSVINNTVMDVEFDGIFAGQLFESGALTVQTGSLTGGSLTLTTTQAGNVDIDEPVLTVSYADGIRILKYVPLGATSQANPVLRLALGSAQRACLSVQGTADNLASNTTHRLRIFATGGTYTLTASIPGQSVQTTAALPYNASASQVLTALSGLTGVSGNISVTSQAVGSYAIEYTNTLGNKYIPPLSINASSLTGSPQLAECYVTQPVGTVARLSTRDVYAEGLELDGNGATLSRGFEIVRSGTTKGMTQYAYLNRSRITNVTSNCVYIEPQLNSSSTDGPRGVGLLRTNLDATKGVGHTVVFAALSYGVVAGCSFEGGSGDAANDNHLEVAEFVSGSPQLQVRQIFRYNGFRSTGGKNCNIRLQGNLKRIDVSHNNLTGARTGIRVTRSSGAIPFSTGIIVERNAIHHIGLSTVDRAIGIWIDVASGIDIRTNAFWENGVAQGLATANGQDIFIDSAGGASGINDRAIRIFHNSLFRSYKASGAPLFDINDARNIQHFNNAYHYLGGLGNGATTQSIVRFRSAAYARPPRNERQQITINNATGGSYRLNWNGAGSPTALIAYNATALQVQSALGALSTIGGTNNIEVVGNAGGPYTVTFKGALANTDQVLIAVDTNLLTGTLTPTIDISATVDGDAGLVSSDGNVYFAPNLLVSSTTKPFVINGSNRVPFDDATLADWRNSNNPLSLDVWDVHGKNADPGFRNGASGNFRPTQTSPVIETGQKVGIRFDIYGSVRGGTPDAGAVQFSITDGNNTFEYQPSPLLALPSANGILYQDGGVQIITALEPVQAADPNSAFDVDNRPHFNLAARDNLIATALDALLLDINQAFCSNPQPGSTFASPHTSILSFMRVATNPDGTIKLSGIDLSGLGFLRIDGGNEMLADLNMGENRIRSVAQGQDSTDGAQLGQVIQKKGDTVNGFLTFSAGGLDMANKGQINGLITASKGDQAPRLDQVVQRQGDTMTGTLSMGGNVIDMGEGSLKNLRASVDGADATRRDEVLLLAGGTVLGTTHFHAGINMDNSQIVGLAAGTNPGHAVRLDQVLLLVGGVMAGNIDMGGHALSNLPLTPGSDSSAATKKYVDDSVGVGFQWFYDLQNPGRAYTALTPPWPKTRTTLGSDALPNVGSVKNGVWLIYLTGTGDMSGGLRVCDPTNSDNAKVFTPHIVSGGSWHILAVVRITDGTFRANPITGFSAILTGWMGMRLGG